MAEVQTTYDDTLAAGHAGMVANGETSNRISRTCELAAGIAFGVPVFRGSNDHGCTTDQTGSPAFLGLSIAQSTEPLEAGETADLYQQYANVAILTLGSMLVTVGEDVTAGAQAYVTSAGAIVDTVGSNTKLDGWFFDEAASNGGLGRISKR